MVKRPFLCAGDRARFLSRPADRIRHNSFIHKDLASILGVVGLGSFRIFLAFGCWRLAVGLGELGSFRIFLAFGCWVLAIGCWLLAVGLGELASFCIFWLLAVGFWRLALWNWVRFA